MTEDKDFTTGVQTVAMEPETARIIWVKKCADCDREFKSTHHNQEVCNGCIKRYKKKHERWYKERIGRR